MRKKLSAFGRRGLVIALLAGAACASPRAVPPPVLEPVPLELPPEPIDLRATLQPVPVPDAFAAAMQRGTRSADGRPGPEYWQQRVEYAIDAELDPATATVSGAGKITYRNDSPDTLRMLVVHLYQNAFARAAAGRSTRGMQLERVHVGGRAAARIIKGTTPPAGRATYEIDGTVMRVHLARPLPPRGVLRAELDWRFRVPSAPAPRMGSIDDQLFAVAQWYPQVAVYDDVDGWSAPQYTTRGEFYLEYGDFDVSLTLPEGWLVGATGVLQNPEDVLTEDALGRLAAARTSDDVVAVVGTDDRAARQATQRTPGGQLTWRFRARNVRDFAFAASDRYVWDATRALLPDADGDGDEEAVLVHALYRPGAGRYRDAADLTRRALRVNAELWGPYVYPQLTAAETPVDGMEYPMLIFVRGFNQPYVLYGTLAHEVTHQWFPMMVGSNEAAFAWQDEGLATYGENIALARFLPDTDGFDESLGGYLAGAIGRREEPLMLHSEDYASDLGYVVASYVKAGSLLRVLEHVIGRDTLHAALREYAARWHLKHPQALDFFNAIEDYTGRDLDWFWHPWWYTTATFDQAIVRVVSSAAAGGQRVAVTIEDQGDAPLPVLLLLTTESGARHEVKVPVDVWLRGARRHVEVVQLAEPVVRVDIDPARVLPDVDRADNVWRRN